MKKFQREIKRMVQDACPGAEVHLFQTTKNLRLTLNAHGRTMVAHMSTTPSQARTVKNEIQRIRQAFAALVSGENPHARRAK